MKKAHELRLAGVIPQGSDAVLLRFQPDPELASEFRFEPGQYLTLAAGPADTRQWRCYSITSAPGAALDVLVRRVRGGLVSNWLCDNARPGGSLTVLPPAGHFTLRREGEPVLLFAGGSGIAPIFSLARQALENEAPRVSIFYANRNRASAMLMRELEELQTRHGERLEVHYWHDDEDGLPAAARLACFARARPDRDVYLCGPEPFMRNAVEGLAQAGFDAARIYREEFDTAADEPASDADGEHVTRLTVQFGGNTTTLPVRGKESLLSAMLNAGLAVPHACKAGECASCMCRLESGEVERLNNAVLDEDDVADGWLVACRTRALGDTLEVRFP